MVMSESWRLRAGRRAHVVRLLLWPTCSHRSSTHASLASLVGRVVEQSSNVVDEERVKQLRNSLFVREIQRAVEGYPVVVSAAQTLVVINNSPDAFQMHRTNLYYMPSFLALENTVTTTPRHASNVQQLRAVNHVVVFSPRHANTLGFNLETQTTLVFPERSSHPRLHTWRSDLTRSIRYVRLLEMLLSSNGTWWPGRAHGR